MIQVGFAGLAVAAIALVGGALGLAVIVSAAIGYFICRKRGLCPSCHRRTLKESNFMKGQAFVDGGLAPDFWSLHECEACGAKFKLHREKWIHLSAGEWSHQIGQAVPDRWRAVTRVRAGLADIDVWRNEDPGCLRIKPVTKLRESVFLYWSLAATEVPVDAQLIGILDRKGITILQLPSQDGFLTMWSQTRQKAVSSFSINDLP